MGNLVVNASYETPGGKMLKLLTRDVETGENLTIYVRKDALKGVSDLRGFVISGAETKVVTPEGSDKSFVHLVRATLSSDEQTIKVFPRQSQAEQSRTGTSQSNRGSQQSQQTQQRTGQERGSGGSGFIVIKTVTPGEKSYKIVGEHVKGRDRQPITAYINKTKIPGSVNMEGGIILKPHIESVERNGRQFTVISSGIVRDKDRNNYSFGQDSASESRRKQNTSENTDEGETTKRFAGRTRRAV